LRPRRRQADHHGPRQGARLRCRRGPAERPSAPARRGGGFRGPRPRGAFRPTGKTGRQRAGLLLTDGTRFLKVQRVAAPLPVLDSQPVEPLGLEWSAVDGAQVFFFENKPALEERAYLRIQRRGRSLLPAFSEDGRKWTRMRTSLPRLMDGIRLSG